MGLGCGLKGLVLGCNYKLKIYFLWQDNGNIKYIYF